MTVNPSKLDDVVTTCNKMHKNLKFAFEIETDWGISSFDLRVVGQGDLCMSVSWYKKITDTNVILIYCSWALAQYKNALVRGTIHKFFQITAVWKNVEDLGRVKKVLEANQYPPSAYNLIRDSLNRILGGSEGEQRKNNPSVPQTLFIHST